MTTHIKLTSAERRAAKIAALQRRQAIDLGVAEARAIIDSLPRMLREAARNDAEGAFEGMLTTIDDLRATVGRIAGVEVLP